MQGSWFIYLLKEKEVGKRMNSFAEVFEAVKQYCMDELNLSEVAKKIWLDHIKPVSLNGNDAIFYCNSEFQKSLIETKYKDLITTAFEQVIGFPVNIRLIVAESEEEMTEQYEPTIQPDIQDDESTDKKAEALDTFETFIVGRSNEFAYAACTSVAKGNSPYNPLFIYGPSGLGKTHLLNAIMHAMHESDPSLKIIYVNGETFANELIEAIHQKKDTSKFHEKYRGADVLLVDDVQFISGWESRQHESLLSFDNLHSDWKQIVLTSDRPPKDIKILDDRIRTRFESGLIADVSAPDVETRIAIIRRKAEMLDLYIPDDVVEFIANRLKCNIRQLEGAVKKLNALKQLAGSPPSISIVQSVIRDILTDDQPIPVTVEKIMAEVSALYGISVEDMRSSKRSSQISNARKVAIYLVREITQLPLTSIGEEFGNRDHSTIVYSVKTVSQMIAKDPDLRDAVQSIMKTIRDGAGK